MGNMIFDEGYDAYLMELPESANPYGGEEDYAAEWLKGHRTAAKIFEEALEGEEAA